MTVPRHYHAWYPCWFGKGLRMLAVKRTKTDIERQSKRGRKVVVKRWWRTKQAASQAASRSGVRARVFECDLGDECPERLDVLAN